MRFQFDWINLRKNMTIEKKKKERGEKLVTSQEDWNKGCYQKR